IPSVLAGAALFAAVAGLAMFLVPDEAARPAGFLANLVIGLGFALAQKPYFEGWKTAHWRPEPGERYRPNGPGQLVLVGILGLSLEVAAVLVLVALGAAS